MVVGTLKCPLSYLDELTPKEIGWLIESHNEDNMDHYEMIASAVTFGYISAKKGKKQKMFKKRDDDKVRKITQEKKDEDMKYIENLFANKGDSN